MRDAEARGDPLTQGLSFGASSFRHDLEVYYFGQWLVSFGNERHNHLRPAKINSQAVRHGLNVVGVADTTPPATILPCPCKFFVLVVPLHVQPTHFWTRPKSRLALTTVTHSRIV
jgi:hypothetical protein